MARAWTILGHAGGGGMGAMGRAEGVVDVDIGQLRQLLAEGVVVGFLLVVDSGDFPAARLRRP